MFRVKSLRGWDLFLDSEVNQKLIDLQKWLPRPISNHKDKEDPKETDCCDYFLQKPNKLPCNNTYWESDGQQGCNMFKIKFILENLILTRLVYWNFLKLMNHEMRFYYREENT